MILHASLTSVVLALSLASAPAPTRTPADLREHDRSADFLARASIDDVNATLDAVASLGFANRFAISALRKELDRRLGFSTADPSAWLRRGVSSKRPVSLSLVIDEAGVERTYREIFQNPSWSSKRNSSPAFVRFRAAIPISDERAGRKLIRGYGSRLDWEPSGQRAFSKQGDLGLVVRRKGRYLVMTATWPVFGARLPTPSRRTFLASLSPPSERNRLPRRLSGAAKTLAASGINVRFRPGSIPRLGRLQARHDHVVQLAANPSLQGSGPISSAPECVEISSAKATPFSDAAIRLAVTPDAISIETIFGGDPKALAKLFPRAPHSLDVHRRGNVSAWFAGWLANAAGLRRFSRPPSLSSFPAALRYLRQCAPHHSLSAYLFAWPLVAAVFADEIAALGPRGTEVAKHAGGFAAAIATWNKQPLASVGALEGTLAPVVEPMARELVGRVFGKSTKMASGTRWGRGRMRAYIRGDRIGVTLGGDTGATWLDTKAATRRLSWLDGTEIAAGALVDSDAIAAVINLEPRLGFIAGAKSLRIRAFLRGEQLVLATRLARK